MILVRCNNGHFYDHDKYGDNCPYCVQVSEAAPQPAASEPQVMPVKQAAPEPQVMPVKQEVPEPQVVPSKQAAPEVVPVKQEVPVPSTVPNVQAEAVQEKMVRPVVKEPVNILEAEDNKTVGYYSRVIGIEPVVGWLVCIDGVYKGESFKLKSGRNFIGRAANMDVVLSADHSISRFKHATVIYEPRSRQFIVTSGESHELCYINDEVVLSNMKLKAYDVLDLGNTSLMLIPCCGKKFTWETGLVKEEDKEEEKK